MTHIKYPKIYHIGKEETYGIFDGEVYIQEKIDGANLQIGLDEGGIYIGSRTQMVYSNGTLHKEFSGVEKYVLEHEGINNLLEHLGGDFVLYGEWLVKHTIDYPAQFYNKFYLFDIYNKLTGEFMDINGVYLLNTKYPDRGTKIEMPELLYWGKSDADHAKSFINTDVRGVIGEGIVIKNLNFVNQFGNMCYAKMVREDFKEANQIVFGNYNKSDYETEFAVKFINEARVMKIINKIEQNENRKIDIRDTPKIMGMCYYDAFNEDLREFVGKRTVDFSKLQKRCGERSKYFFHEYLKSL